jgi:phosphate transport system protein
MLRPQLIKQITDLKNEVVAMSELVLTQINDAFESFKQNDLVKATNTMKKDDLVDKFEEDIAKSAIRIIWKEQPMAQDLRLVTGILKLITDIERIGDHAADISEITIHLSKYHHKRILPIATKMMVSAQLMVSNAIKALVELNYELASKVIAADDEVDGLFEEVMQKIAKELKEDKIEHQYALSILMVVKYIERVGDHATNIAEWVKFMITGEHKETPLF